MEDFMDAFFGFKEMISGFIIKFLYALGMVFISLWALALIFSEDQVLYGVLALIFGNLLWRLVCEVTIILFSIHESITNIKRIYRGCLAMKEPEVLEKVEGEIYGNDEE